MNWKVFLFLLSGKIVMAQEFLSTSEVLKTSFNDPEVVQLEKLIQFASELKFHHPWIKSISGRIGITGSALGDTIYGYIRNEDNYALFIEPNSLLEIRRQKQIKGTKISLYDADLKYQLEDAINDRYQALIEFIWADQWRGYYGQLDSLTNLKINYLQKAIQLSRKVDIGDVVRADRDKLRYREELKKYESLRNQSINTIEQITKQPVSGVINVLELISAIDLANSVLLQDNSQQSMIKSNEEHYSESKIKYLIAKDNFNQAQNRKIFNDLRLSYDNPLYLNRPNKFNTFNNLSIRVGLNLPLPINNRFKRAESQLDIYEERINLERIRNKRQDLYGSFSNTIEGIKFEYYAYLAMVDSSLVNRIAHNLEYFLQLEPLDRIDLLIKEKEYLEQKLKLEEALMRACFEVLKLKGEIYTSPYKNFLHKDMQEWGKN